jgi:6-pyruvoyltetrahydropterin/6-carboxytetrahydropterin synthase
MYEVGVVAQFEAAHRLVGDFGPATRMHGHTYRVEVVVRGERLRDDGVLFDIGRLRESIDALMATMHLRDLADVPGLAGINTTAEAVADYCWAALETDLRGHGLATLLVRVWESPLAWAARDDALPG